MKNQTIIKKPPLGLKPRYLVEEERILEISSAILRYVNCNYEIPIEWVEEYNELVGRNFKL